VTDNNLPQALKDGMRFLASGVCVVTAVAENGERAAMTASSVTSVSDDPPSLLVCVNKQAAISTALGQSSAFAVNVLNQNQQSVSVNCATPGEGEKRFTEGNWAIDDVTGLSYLTDALSVFICEKQKVTPYGTHNIFIANVTNVILNRSESPILVYAKGAYHSI